MNVASRNRVFETVESLGTDPVAFQALWDGDTTGWFVRLSAATNDGKSHDLGVLSDGGDFRVFTGEVPLWPEAAAAQQLGKELVERYGAEFYFPSPDHPEDECPDWKDRAKGYPCRRCGMLLLQDRDHPWRGICNYCHRAEEREKREAKWTPEERAGPRCYFCGMPATKEVEGRPACADCFDGYEVYRCEKCGSVTTFHGRSVDRTSKCFRCQVDKMLGSPNASQLRAIRDAFDTGYWNGLGAAKKILGCSLARAQYVVVLIGKLDTSEDQRSGDA